MKQLLYRIVAVIAALTLLSGLGQLLMPGLVLRLIGAEATPTSLHLFAIVGMFMALFGGMVLHALVSARHHRIVLLWAALQKLGAFAAVTLGVANDLFSPLAMAVAFFDLASGLLMIAYLLMIRHEPERNVQLL
ncbi:patatin [Rhodothermaceae bacterium RA]|nr:patatin [Rhodothermaceae bacterium RA]